MSLLDSIVNNPSLWIEASLFWFFPVLTHEIIPVFECICIVLEVRMLAPSLKAPDRAETILESLDDYLAE